MDWNDRGVGHMLAGEVDDARACFLKALAERPDWDVARFHLAQTFLSRGEYGVGWLLYEARNTIPPLSEPIRPLLFPEWRGESVRGKRVAVFGEQGLGDQIMFARFLPELAKRGADVRYICAPEVAPLFPGAVSSWSGEADYWTRVATLPLWLHTGPLPPPFAPRVALAAGGGIGVVPTGGPDFWNDAHRSLPPAEAERLLALGRDLRPEATGAADFLETARIVAGLDLVITVDTAVAHLSASMGKPMWILLPAHGTDWRWGRESEASPWYPTARLIRQPAPGRWSAVLDRLEDELQPRMKTARTRPAPPVVLSELAMPPPPGVPPRVPALPPPMPPR